MYRVLIVDDEMYAVKGLVEGVDWNRLGVGQVFEAFHAREARAVLERNEIDLMICDIAMPEENGLELLEWAKTWLPELETVFLTCHDDFKFAQKALQLGSCDYLLKPVAYEELEQVLSKNLDKILKKRHDNEKIEGYSKYYDYFLEHQGDKEGEVSIPAETLIKAGTNRIVLEVQNHIRENVDKKLTREELADYVHVNASYLSRLFHKETGMSLSDFILNERMKKAGELIATGDEPIGGIAVRLCYDNFSYFAKMFKKVYSLTPQEYRKKYARTR